MMERCAQQNSLCTQSNRPLHFCTLLVTAISVLACLAQAIQTKIPSILTPWVRWSSMAWLTSYSSEFTLYLNLTGNKAARSDSVAGMLTLPVVLSSGSTPVILTPGKFLYKGLILTMRTFWQCQNRFCWTLPCQWWLRHSRNSKHYGQNCKRFKVTLPAVLTTNASMMVNANRLQAVYLVSYSI